MDDIDLLIGLEMSRKKSGLEPQTAEFVVMNRQVQSEANIKDLQIFSTSDDDLFSAHNIIDLQKGGRTAQTNKYDHLNIASNFMDGDINENFNFKQLMSSQNQQVLEGLDIIQLQTFEQLFFNNFQKIKASFRKFKG